MKIKWNSSLEVAYKQTKDIIKELESPIIDPDHYRDPQDGDVTKVDAVFGSTKIKFNSIDEEILRNIPDELREKIKTIPDHMAIFSSCNPEPGRIQVWVRLKELNPKLGRWYFWDVTADPSEIQFCPEGRSANAFYRVIGQIQAYGEYINKKEFVDHVKGLSEQDSSNH